MFKPRLNDRGMLESLGLVGDGEEISAIEEVERQFGVTLDHSRAATWRCVGDIHTTLLAALPSGR